MSNESHMLATVQTALCLWIASAVTSAAIIYPIDGPKRSPDSTDGDAEFSTRVDLDGDTAVIGAPEANAGFAGSGSAYVQGRDVGGADAWGKIKKLIASDLFTADAFGTDVAISGDFIAVGAPDEDTEASGGGAVYVFHRNEGGTDQWGEVAKLTIPGIDSGANMGAQVDLSGFVLMASAPEEHFDRGEVYVFVQTGAVTNWVFLKTIVPGDPGTNDRFGTGLSLSGDTLVVGSPFNESLAAGSAYVFLKNQGGPSNWGQVKKLTPTDPSSGARFGSSIFLDGSRVVIGAPEKDEGPSQAGAAYLFDANQGGSGNWGQVAKLSADDPSANDHFGSSVGLSGDTAIVGAPDDNAPNIDSGSAYLFDEDLGGSGQWGQVTKFAAFDGTSNDEFGRSMVIRGTDMIVGAPFDRVNKGAAYFFNFGTNTPPNIADQNFDVPENSSIFTVVGDVVATELDGGQFLTYAITGGSGETAFSIGSLTGKIRVSDPAQLDFETVEELEVIVQVTDSLVAFPLSSTATVTVAITDVTEQSDLAMIKTAPILVSAGIPFTYTLIVTNNGPDAAFNVSVVDQMPPGLTPAGHQVFPLGTIAVGSSKTVMFEATAGVSALGLITNLAVASSTNEGDPNPANNTNTAISAVTQLGDISILKSATPELDISDQIDFVLVVSNAGPWAAQNVSLVDNPPSYLEIDVASLPASCFVFDGTINCALGELAAGAVTQVLFSATVAPTAPDTVLNTGKVSANNDVETNNNVSTSMTTLLDNDGDGSWNFADPDDDNDSMLDDWELQYGLNPSNAADAAENNDSDVPTNAEEHAADTNPNDSNAFFRISGVFPSVVVEYQSSSNRLYSLERSEDLPATNWNPVAGQTLIPGSGGIDSLTDTGTAPTRSHRVRVSTPPP